MVGQKVKKLRKNLRMSQQELALNTGLSQAAISNIEAGIKSPTFRTLQKLAHALGVSVTDLLEDDRARTASK